MGEEIDMSEEQKYSEDVEVAKALLKDDARVLLIATIKAVPKKAGDRGYELTRIKDQDPDKLADAVERILATMGWAGRSEVVYSYEDGEVFLIDDLL